MNQLHNTLVNTLNECVHMIWDEQTEQAHGITQDEHERRHHTFVLGMLIGLRMSIEYPKTTLRAAKIHRDLRPADMPPDTLVTKMADMTAEAIGMTLWPQEYEADFEKLKAVADNLPPAAVRSTSLPVFDAEGHLTWSVKPRNKWPFPSMHEQYETWEHVE